VRRILSSVSDKSIACFFVNFVHTRDISKLAEVSLEYFFATTTFSTALGSEPCIGLYALRES
jgi:hypothetical protein